ncbi:MAG: ATP-grasp domain-containing protein [Methyloligellaceae bacterium]
MTEYRIAEPLRILQTACAHSNLDISFIGEESGHLARVSDGTSFFYSGGAETPTYPLNNAVGQDLCNDKSYCSDLLSNAGLEVPKGKIFFPGFSKDNAYKIYNHGIPDALNYVHEEHEYPVIVKPNRGSMGRGVQLVSNDTDFVLAMQQTVEYGHACLVQECIRGDEYRLFCLDGLPRFIYRKQKPSVTGDGISTLRELFRQSQNVRFELLELRQSTDFLWKQKSCFISESLSESIWDGVPQEGAIINLSGLGNLAAGCQIDQFKTRFEPAHYEMAKVVSEVLQVQICGIDFFSKGEGFSDNIIIEVNGNPSLRGTWESGREKLCIDIWQDIFRLYFK